ncbi:MAG: ATP synthase F1 subunit delta [Candidatus Izemoplasmatales bacterium]
MTDFVREYALALFSLASEDGTLDKVSESLQGFISNLDLESRLFFSHPAFQKSEKKLVIEKLNVHPLLSDFLKVLIDNERFEFIDEISISLEDIIKNQNQLLKVEVLSKEPLEKVYLTRIKNKLEKDYNRKVLLEETTDKSIIAGYKLRFEGYELDDTASRRLKDLVTTLKKN